MRRVKILIAALIACFLLMGYITEIENHYGAILDED